MVQMDFLAANLVRIMFTVWMFTFVAASCGSLYDRPSIAFLLAVLPSTGEDVRPRWTAAKHGEYGKQNKDWQPGTPIAASMCCPMRDRIETELFYIYRYIYQPSANRY